MTEELELRLLQARDPDLLEAVHRNLFLPNFPDPDEYEGPEDWIPRLWDDPPPPTPRQHTAVAGADLDDPLRRSLAGFASVEHYRRSHSALLSYVAVVPEWRAHGLGRRLVELALRSATESAGEGGIVAVFAEIHDPEKVVESSDVIDPATRVRVMDRLGALRVPIRYVQPPLGEGAPSDRLLLIVFPQGSEAVVESETVAAFLAEYYEACDVPAGDANLAAMIEQLPGGPIALERL